jgi:hypothetical protein
MTIAQTYIKSYLNHIARAFALPQGDGFAFELLSQSVILGLPFNEVYEQSLIKNSDNPLAPPEDGGIDGVYFEQLHNQENGYDYIMHVFQCKYSHRNPESINLSTNDLENFKTIVTNVFQNDRTKPNSKHLQPKIAQYKNLVNELNIIKIKQYFVFCGDKNQSNNNKPLSLLYHQANYNDISFEIWDINDLFNKIIELRGVFEQTTQIQFTFLPTNSNISPNDPQALITYTINNVRSVQFRIAARQLYELMQEADRTQGNIQYLFSKNIRSFLGSNTYTNQQIFETLNDNNINSYFYFLNNGITIITERMVISPLQNNQYLIKTTNPIIVNGLQTSYSIYKTLKEQHNRLENVYITIKLYETNDQDLVERITKSTNTQNNIYSIDSLSNKEFSQWAKVIFQNKGYNYMTKRGEMFTTPPQTRHIRQEIALEKWYFVFTLYDTDKYSYLRFVEKATTETQSEYHFLFNGAPESPLYRQMFFAYTLDAIFRQWLGQHPQWLHIYQRKNQMKTLLQHTTWNLQQHFNTAALNNNMLLQQIEQQHNNIHQRRNRPLTDPQLQQLRQQHIDITHLNP